MCGSESTRNIAVHVYFGLRMSALNLDDKVLVYAGSG